MEDKRVEPAEVKLLPVRLRIGLDEYRRNRRTPHNIFCLFIRGRANDWNGRGRSITSTRQKGLPNWPR